VESVYSAVVNRIVASQSTVCTLCSCYAATWEPSECTRSNNLVPN